MSRYPYNTAAWLHLREAKLAADPLCEACIRREIVEVATVVDHVLAIAKGGDPFPALHELMSMCAPCHNRKTNAIDHPSASGFRRALGGYDIEGNPIDPEGWEGPSVARARPGGLQSLEAPDPGPAPTPRTDLVLQTVRNKEAETWV